VVSLARRRGHSRPLTACKMPRPGKLTGCRPAC